MANKNLYQSFACAFQGLSHVIWTQRQVRVQFLIIMLVLLLSFVLKLEAVKVLFVLSAIALVLVAEIINTAIEVLVNMVTESYHPLARIVKDVAAAGVLIASFYAAIVGVVVFFDAHRMRQWLASTQGLEVTMKPDLVVIVLLAVALVSILVPLVKVRSGRGTILRGGVVSGHTAVAFLLFAAISVYSQFKPLITILSLVLAILVAQSRVEGKIHTVAEVLWGATVALVLMALLLLISLSL